MVLTMSLADLVSSRGDTNKARGRRELWHLDELTKDSSFAKEVNLLGMKQTYSCIIISSSLSPMLILLLVLLYNRYDTREGQPPDCGAIQRELLCLTSNRNYVAALMEGYLISPLIVSNPPPYPYPYPYPYLMIEPLTYLLFSSSPVHYRISSGTLPALSLLIVSAVRTLSKV